MDKVKIIVLAIMGVGMGLNGLFMLADPLLWYDTTPGVNRTGPPNVHFIRDIGLAYFGIGIALIIAIRNLTSRFVLCFVSASWLGGHGLFHVWEVLAGVCTPAQFMTDFPGVIVPALIIAWLAFAVRNDAKEL